MQSRFLHALIWKKCSSVHGAMQTLAENGAVVIDLSPYTHNLMHSKLNERERKKILQGTSLHLKLGLECCKTKRVRCKSLNSSWDVPRIRFFVFFMIKVVCRFLKHIHKYAVITVGHEFTKPIIKPINLKDILSGECSWLLL